MGARRSQTDALTLKVKRLIYMKGDRKAMGAQLCALGDDAIATLCSLAESERELRGRLRWLCAGTIILGYLLQCPFIVRSLPTHVQQVYQYWMIVITGIGSMGFLLGN